MSETGTAVSPEAELVAAVEAVLFAAGEPVALAELAAAFGGIEEETLLAVVDALERGYAERGSGLLVEQVAGGYRLATRSESGPWVRRFFRHHHRTRLSPAALETLAIVAYRQPVTGPEIQAIRGVDPAGSLKSLLEKKLVRILGRKKVVGSPLLYGTSRTFLVHFGLNRLGDLPSLTEFEDVLGSLEAAREASGGSGGADPAEAEGEGALLVESEELENDEAGEPWAPAGGAVARSEEE